MRVADFHRDALAATGFATQPICAIHFEALTHKVFFVADDDAVGLRVDVDDIAWARGAPWQALALADGEHFDAFVFGYEVAIGVVDASLVELLFAQVAAQEGLVVITRHEADFLAVHLVGNLQSESACDFADFGFFHSSQRCEGVLKLILTKAKEEIRLVLAGVTAFAKDCVVLVMVNDRVVSGGDEVRSERAGLCAEVAEFEVLVAHHTRVRCAALFVFAGEVVDDDFFKIVSLIDDIMGDAQLVGNAACIRYGRGSAAFVFRPGDAILRPNFHGHADNLPSIALQKRSRHAGIHSAAHSEQHSSAIAFHGSEHKERRRWRQTAGASAGDTILAKVRFGD